MTEKEQTTYIKGSVSLPASILVGVTGNAVYIKVRGKGSFQNSPALKEFARQMLERGHRIFAFDLGECTVMDSTFMGTLAGMALRLRESGGTLLVRNVNERKTHPLARRSHLRIGTTICSKRCELIFVYR